MKKQLLERFYFDVKGIDYQIEGKIYDLGDSFPLRYQWTLSHYCSPQPEMGVYIPSRNMESSMSSAQKQMEKYIRDFTTYNISVNSMF